MTRGLLDTNVLILMDAVDPNELPDELAISVITIAELSVGPIVADDPEERAARQDVLTRVESEFEPLPFTTQAARAFGRAYATYLAAQRSPRRHTADLMIASIAMAYGLPLYTANPHDFTPLRSLVTVVPVTHPHTRE
jgi:predicted nucleic acid-binding protein